jgi:hypothetical protein
VVKSENINADKFWNLSGGGGGDGGKVKGKVFPSTGLGGP